MKTSVLALAAGLALTATTASAQELRTYDVTIINLTNGQPFSPGVAVTHQPNIYLFRPGAPTNPGVAKIAKDGDPESAVAALNRFRGRGVTDVVTAERPVMTQTSGGSSAETFTIQARDGDALSWARMLICTNDGIVGMDSIPLNGQPVALLAQAFDSGSEINDERSASIVDACGGIGPVALGEDGNNDNLPADGNITRVHSNIQGVGNLGAIHSWNGPVARVVIEPRRNTVFSGLFR